jgi:geranylgeranyl reductase family protein
VNHAPSSNSPEVVIVGSGPAGASAALCLATAGVEVAVLERAALPRYKTCGGGVTRRALRLLPLSIRDAVERDCFVAEMNLHDMGLRFETRRQDPIVSMTMRAKFDSLLLSAARDAGVSVQPSCNVLDVFPHGERVALTTSTGPLSARFVIAADGAIGAVAGKTNRPDDRRLIPALEYEVFVGDDLLEKFTRSARFDFGLVPYGYGWVFPKKEHLSIGVLTKRGGSANLNERFHSYLRLLGITPILRMERHGSLIPVAARTAPFAVGRLLLVGDAAGFVDPVTCEGITFAIQSGQIAARSLIGGNLRAEEVSRAYDAEIAAKILPELTAARRLATILYDCPTLRAVLVRLYGQRLCEAVTDIMTGDRTYRQIISKPANYFKLLKVWERGQERLPR